MNFTETVLNDLQPCVYDVWVHIQYLVFIVFDFRILLQVYLQPESEKWKGIPQCNAAC